jgi:hypothetical protein
MQAPVTWYLAAAMILTVARSPGEAVVAAAAGALGVMIFAWTPLSRIKLESNSLEVKARGTWKGA